MAVGDLSSAAKIRMEDIPAFKRIIAFGFLLIFDFFYGWAWNSVDVLRPDIRATLGLSLTEASLMYTAQSAGALIGAIVIGQLADRFGRRNSLFVVMVSYSLALLSGVFVTNFEQLIVQRFVLGFFLGGVFPVAVGIYTGLFDRRANGKLAGFYNATFSGSVVALGFIVATVHVTDWHILLLMGAIPPLLLAPLAFVLVPNDRTTQPFGDVSVAPAAGKLPALELFTPALRSKTLMVALMIGLNFFAYQAFAGWQTTYLQESLLLSSETAKMLLAWQFGATIVAGFIWGGLSDRLGRRFNAFGFVGVALTIFAYLFIGDNVIALGIAGIVLGCLLPASVIWGPWLAEMYPPHLRSTAASIFNWGRIISLFAPPITAAIAMTSGLSTAMGLGGICWLLSAAVWRLLPETVVAKDVSISERA